MRRSKRCYVVNSMWVAWWHVPMPWHTKAWWDEIIATEKTVREYLYGD